MFLDIDDRTFENVPKMFLRRKSNYTLLKRLCSPWHVAEMMNVVNSTHLSLSLTNNEIYGLVSSSKYVKVSQFH